MLGLHAAATEAWAPRARAQPQEKPLQQGHVAPQPESSPCSPQLEKDCACGKEQRPSAAKNK